jgi:REP element-mobilizing transposase RayT
LSYELPYCQQNKGLDIFAWCVMTSHVHLIIRAQDGYQLEGILRDYKKCTSKAIIQAIKDNPVESRREWLLEQFKSKDSNTFWQGDNHPIEFWSNEVIDQKLSYIHQNPVEEGIVFQAEEYLYSSARDYAGENGMLDVLVIEL